MTTAARAHDAPALSSEEPGRPVQPDAVASANGEGTPGAYATVGCGLSRLELLLLERLVSTPDAAVTWDELLDCSDRSFVAKIRSAQRLREIEAAILHLQDLLDADERVSARIRPAEPHGFVYSQSWPPGPACFALTAQHLETSWCRACDIATDRIGETR